MGSTGTTLAPFLPVPSQHQTIHKIWTPGKNLAFPDKLSRNVKLPDLKQHQLTRKKIPKDIKFFDEHGESVKFFIEHGVNTPGNYNDFSPILAQTRTGQKRLTLTNDGNDFLVDHFDPNNISSVHEISDCFKLLPSEFLPM